MTSRILPWAAAAVVVTLAGVQVVRTSPLELEASDEGVSASEPVEEPTAPAAASPRASAGAFVASPREPDSAVEPAPLESRRSWCESLAPPFCPSTDFACPSMPDGTVRRCRKPYLSPREDLACMPSVPPRSVRKERAQGLYTIAVELRSTDPVSLSRYLRVLAVRESSLRPWKRHRLSADIESAETAWGRRAEVFKDSPAYEEPWRWREGLGYYGQNPALWLDLWDASAEPETLCGEVESTIVHLRAARKRWRRIARGIECEGAGFWGTADGGDGRGAPSWYDISLVNSGSSACPATSGKRLELRRSFERRAKRVGLDPYGRVRLSDLGEPIEREAQERLAKDLRGRL